MADPATLPPWREAWREALYGERGFYVCGAGPAAHFRTASHAAPSALASALARLAEHHGCTRVVEVAAGGGELAGALAKVAPELRVTAIDLVTRPEGLPERVTWVTGTAPAIMGILPRDARTLTMAWEWLDVVPCTIVELDDDGAARVVLVDPRTGAEHLGPPPADDEAAWLERWWPLGTGEPGDRAEVGLPRDQAWAGLVSAAAPGVLLAVDYDHDRTTRPPPGSLSGFRAGRQVPPRPDGGCDITAHVALDAVAAAGEAAGARTLELARQRDALIQLGSDQQELIDAGALGGFGWLLQRV